MQLGVLDQSPIAEGSTPAQALHNTLDLAEHAERLGYHRYWVAEHHATPALACAAPEILIGAIASRTEVRTRPDSVSSVTCSSSGEMSTRPLVCRFSPRHTTR